MNGIQNKSVLERFMLPNKTWNEGYKRFGQLFGKPLGWLYVFQDGAADRMIRLNQKGNCSFYAKSPSNELGCLGFLNKYFEQLKDNPQKQKELPYIYKCAYGRMGCVFGIFHGDQLRGFLILCTIGKTHNNAEQSLELFNQFLQTQVELAYKSYELQNFYETVHPRALALSTMHSVNRIIASSLKLDQLLPQIGRLFSQVLKAKECRIYFMDSESKFLIPKFGLRDKKTLLLKSRIRIGRGIEGRIAETAEFYLSRNSIGVPFIADDVIGIVVLKDRMDKTPFGNMDLEILKTLSEQAVVAIRNAQLFDQTEKLTLSSIHAINELLEQNYGNSNIRLPLFGELVFEIGKDLRLSGIDLTNMHRATFLIDTGLLITPEHIMAKKSALTKVEFNQIKKHPKLGASVLEKMGVFKQVIPMVLYHHEKYDGTGYPDGLAGDKIPIGARIVGLVDAFTAMLLFRPYRKSKSAEEAIEEIKQNSGTQFDPKIVTSFLKVIESAEILRKIHRLADSAGDVKSRPQTAR